MLDLQTIKSYVLHFETLEIKSSGNPISLYYHKEKVSFHYEQHPKKPCKQFIQR